MMVVPFNRMSLHHFYLYRRHLREFQRYLEIWDFLGLLYFDQDFDNAEEDSTSDDGNDNEELELIDGKDYLETAGLDGIDLELIDGDKLGSQWLVVDGIYICHKYADSETEVFWECSGRRKYGCPFKLGTVYDEECRLTLSYMYKLTFHDCEQTKMGPIMQKFRSKLKYKMSTDLRAKFYNVFNEEKKNLLSEYSDSPDLLERIIYELKDKRSYRVAAQRAKAKVFPKNPRNHEEIDLHKIGLEAWGK